KIFRTTLDAHVVAYDAKSGKELWKSKVAEWKDGYSLTLAPLIANGVLITGISGAEFGIRGFIDGWDPETGKQLWRRHTIPARGDKGNETWPQDNNHWGTGGGAGAPILAELKVAGKMRKVVMQLNRNGFLYVLDRASGELLSAKAYEKVNWASHVDPKTGRPVETDIAKSIRDMKATEHWPSTRGAKNWQHAAFNPKTGLLYANTMHDGRMHKHLDIQTQPPRQRDHV